MRPKLTSLLVVAVLGLMAGALQGCVHTDHEGQVIQPKPWSPPGGAGK